MKSRLKKLIVTIGFLSTTFTNTHAGIMTKADFLEIIEETNIESMCSSESLQCYEMTVKSCKSDIVKALGNRCSAGLPEEIEDMDAVRDHSASITSCLVIYVLGPHFTARDKNVSTAACKKVMGE